jgi:nitroreductase
MTETLSRISIDRRLDTGADIHPLLATRYSPRAYQPEFDIAPETITALLEAARWAPSASNLQPRRFILGLRGDAAFSQLFDALKPINQLWAGRASVLLCGIALTHDDAGNPQHFADYDLGQAVAHLTFQASASGLYVRQIGGFDPDLLATAFDLSPALRPRVVIAIGREAELETLPDELIARETPKRHRLSIDELLIDRKGDRPGLVTE